jgi:hypothetical protein
MSYEFTNECTNLCTNFITIACKDEEVLDNLVRNELQFSDGNNNYVYNETINMIKRGCRGIVFEIFTADNPPYEWLAKLIDTYPNCWIKNEWCNEIGIAGIWICFINIENNEPVIHDFCWNDLSNQDKYYLFLEKSEQT